MKKIVYLAFAAAALCGASSANAQEVTYVEDCSQGLLINQNKNNWFMTIQGGANALFGTKETKVDHFKQRIGADGALYFGKWVTPNFGFRFGGVWTLGRGATTEGATFQYEGTTGNASMYESGYYPERYQSIGGDFDVLINLTNWWCGYKPGRVYNAVVHAGAGACWNLAHNTDRGEYKWHTTKDNVLSASVGLQNNFALGKHVDLFIDLACRMIDFGSVEFLPQANIGFNFNFGKTDWNCPVTAVCPTWKYTDAEGDALVARLANAENKIASLQQQLDACLNRPMPAAEVVSCEGICTIYYPINKSNLTAREKGILRSVAAVMNENPNQKYVLTGWADNYTGSKEYNVQLRHARVNGVKNYLMSCKVAESQLQADIDNSDLTDFGKVGAPLDRAVTIKEAK